jgi:predicted DNA-binding protein (UPF0251 family)
LENLSIPNLPVVSAEVPDRQDESEHPDLTIQEAEACRLVTVDSYTSARAAETVGVSTRTIERWRHKRAWKAYAQRLVDTALAEAGRRVKIRFAREAEGLADRVAALARGQRAKPSHPYADKFAAMLLDRIAPKQAPGPSVSVEALQDGDRQVLRVIVGHPPGRPGPAWARQEGQEASE